LRNLFLSLLKTAALAAGLVLGAVPAHAAVTASFSGRRVVRGATAANFVTVGAPVKCPCA